MGNSQNTAFLGIRNNDWGAIFFDGDRDGHSVRTLGMNLRNVQAMRTHSIRESDLTSGNAVNENGL